MGGVSFTKHDASARAQAITQLLYVTSFVFTLLTSPRIIETTKLRNLLYIAKSCGRILLLSTLVPPYEGDMFVYVFSERAIIFSTSAINCSLLGKQSVYFDAKI